MRAILILFSALSLIQQPCSGQDKSIPVAKTPPENLVLNYHLMHPGGESTPGDPNAAFYLDGIYHLHYILL